MTQARPIGIDLGTTHTLVAVLDEDGPRVLPMQGGGVLLPSVVAVDDAGAVVVGRPARDLAVRAPDRAVVRFKSEMGSDRTWTLAGQTFTPTMLSALVLKEAAALAERALGAPVTHAVVSVPAWFREPQRAATLDAGRLAGITIDRLVNEPTAAAMAHGLHQLDVDHRGVVVDLGGGTFDVTVLEMFAGMIEVSATSGDTHLGGEDITDDLVARVATEAGVALRDLSADAVGRLRHRTEQAKRALSTEAHVSVRTDDLPGHTVPSVGLDRAVLAEVFAPWRQRMRRAIAEALRQAAVLPQAISEVVLVGGATRMVAVQDLVREVFGREPERGLHPDHAIALGAAVQAGLAADDAAVSDLVVTDVLTHSLGVAVVKSWDGVDFPDRFDPVLHRGTTLPCSRREHYFTRHHAQTSVTIRIFEGEHREVDHNAHLGQLTLDGLTPGDDPDHRVGFTVRFTHDTNGLLEIEATVDGEAERSPVTMVLQRAQERLEGDALDRAMAALGTLKTHPREFLPNRIVLERAKRVFTMVQGDDRRTLDELIGAFEASLEREQADQVDARRAVVREWVDRLCRVHGLDREDFDG